MNQLKYYEKRYVVTNKDIENKLMSSGILDSKDTPGEHENYYYPNLRLRHSKYKQDNFEDKYIIMPSNKGRSLAKKEKKFITKKEFDNIKKLNSKNLLFYQKATFYFINKENKIFLEKDKIKIKNKEFTFWATESEAPKEEKIVKDFLKKYNINYIETPDNIRTIVEKLSKQNGDVKKLKGE